MNKYTQELHYNSFIDYCVINDIEVPVISDVKKYVIDNDINDIEIKNYLSDNIKSMADELCNIEL